MTGGKKSNTWLMLNYTLIIAKYHIFATSVGNGSLDFEGFLSRLKSKLTVLRTIATRNHNLKQFTETWAAGVRRLDACLCTFVCVRLFGSVSCPTLLAKQFDYLRFCPVKLDCE